MQKRKRQVMKTAQQLFLKKGYFGTSVQDIIEEAEISKGTFYNYFDSKNECLIAILRYAQGEAFSRRKQLLAGKSKKDRIIFAKQIIVRIEVNREQNLLPLLGFVFHSKQSELRQFAKEYHLLELSWLSKRFIDVYGKEVYPYATDCAAFVLGLVQQYNLLWSFYVEEEIDTENLVMFILKKMDHIVDDFVKSKERFIDDRLFATIESLWRSADATEDKLLQTFILLKSNELKEDEEGRQYIEFIIEELNKAYPRKHLLESITKALKKRYQNHPLENKINEITNSLLEQIYVKD